jgi:hypothetical protein
MIEPCAVITVLTSTSMGMRAVLTPAMVGAACTSEQKTLVVSVTSIFVLNF